MADMFGKNLSRRDLLKLVGAGAATSLAVSACTSDRDSDSASVNTTTTVQPQPSTTAQPQSNLEELFEIPGFGEMQNRYLEAYLSDDPQRMLQLWRRAGVSDPELWAPLTLNEVGFESDDPKLYFAINLENLLTCGINRPAIATALLICFDDFDQIMQREFNTTPGADFLFAQSRFAGGVGNTWIMRALPDLSNVIGFVVAQSQSTPNVVTGRSVACEIGPDTRGRLSQS